MQQQTTEYKVCKWATCCDVNWSPPKALTQGFMPPVPRPISIIAIAGPTLGHSTAHTNLIFAICTYYSLYTIQNHSTDLQSI